FTSDPNNHTGEGIFFTSKIFNTFVIISENLTFAGNQNHEFLFQDLGEVMKGTTVVMMMMKKQSDISISDVFNEYTDPDKEPGFHKTIVPVQLMQYEGESLLSRSQAKRLIQRFDKFLEVVLDFEGVNIIGQAFADEVFRVFQNEHPNVHLTSVNTTTEIKNMIIRASKQ
ncbi:MAG: STAS-like domain-containing protein, partial [Desulfobacteraceae bacterium]|nr:STAS-like domain-containing protein [Desulfobacteraceae bacterium]